jgi:hypothetical protein
MSVLFLTGKLGCRVYVQDCIIEYVKQDQRWDQINIALFQSKDVTALLHSEEIDIKSESPNLIAFRLRALHVMHNLLLKHGLTDRAMRELACGQEPQDYVSRKTDEIENNSALICAFKRGNMESCNLLLYAGADISALAPAQPKTQPEKDEWAKLSQSKGMDVLKFHGWNDWTPLLTATEKGTGHVIQYLQSRRRIQDIEKCLREGTDFPQWFKRKILYHSQVSESRWIWMTYAKSGMQLSESKRKVRKENDNFHYSCALGSITFSKGIYLWTIKLESIKLVWLGLAMGDPINEDVNCRPSAFADGILAFGSDGSLHSSGKMELKRIWNTKFGSDQIVGFKVDVNSKRVEMSIDERLVLTVNEFECQNFRPYVCMGYRESATLLSQKFLFESFLADAAFESFSHEFPHKSWEPALLEHIETIREIGIQVLLF